MPTVTSISAQTQAQTAALSQKVNILSWVLIIVLILLMFKTNYPMIILIDLLQLAYMHIYTLALPLPYLYMNVASTLKNLHFTFLPTIFTNSSPNTNDPYYIFQPDTTFSGNCQPLVFFIAIFGGTYLVFWVLSHRVNKFRWLRRKSKAVFQKRIKYSFLH